MWSEIGIDIIGRQCVLLIYGAWVAGWLGGLGVVLGWWSEGGP